VGHTISSSIRELARTFAYAFDPYRPELHYMRGPGPKWHAKRAAQAAPLAVDIHPMTEAVAARA
jgi:hypothetical protein